MKTGFKSLAAAHLVGNALLLLLGYYWLGLGESSGTLVLWSAAVLLFGIAAAVWLHGAALVFFHRRSDAPFLSAPHLLPLFVLTLFGLALYWLLSDLGDRFQHQAFVIGSYATLKTRKPVAPSAILRTYHVLIAILQWLVVPVLLLPLGAGVANRGWHGFSPKSFRRSFRWRYWVQVAVLLFLALYLPWKIVNWIPHVPGFGAEFISFLVRFLLAYLLFAAGLLALEYLTSAGKPRSNQRITVASP